MNRVYKLMVMVQAVNDCDILNVSIIESFQKYLP